MQNASYSQLLPDHDDDNPASGVRQRHLACAPATQVEHLGSPHHAIANDRAPSSYLINAGAPHSTSYRFLAPRLGRRR